MGLKISRRSPSPTPTVSGFNVKVNKICRLADPVELCYEQPGVTAIDDMRRQSRRSRKIETGAGLIRDFVEKLLLKGYISSQEIADQSEVAVACYPTVNLRFVNAPSKFTLGNL